MSSPADTNWSQARVIPSIIFVLTPCLAVGLLVVWSLRMQVARRRWYAELARQRRGLSDVAVVDYGNKPEIHEVWLGYEWNHSWNEIPNTTSAQGSNKLELQTSLEGYVMEEYKWQSILPVALCGSSKEDGSCNLAVLVRMPSKTPYDEISHTSITYTELNMATVEVKPHLTQF